MNLYVAVLTFAGGIALGWVQCRLFVRALGGKGHFRFWAFAIKIALWLAALVPLGLHNPILAVLFVLGGTAMMIAYGARMMRAARKEE